MFGWILYLGECEEALQGQEGAWDSLVDYVVFCGVGLLESLLLSSFRAMAFVYGWDICDGHEHVMGGDVDSLFKEVGMSGWWSVTHPSGIDVYEDLITISYAAECFECKSTWVSNGRADCPKCGGTQVGVSRHPEGCAVVMNER